MGSTWGGGQKKGCFDVVAAAALVIVAIILWAVS